VRVGEPALAAPGPLHAVDRVGEDDDEDDREREREDALEVDHRRVAVDRDRGRRADDDGGRERLAGGARLVPAEVGREREQGEDAEDAVDRLERHRRQPCERGVGEVAAGAEDRARERHRRQPGARAADRRQPDRGEQQRAGSGGDQGLGDAEPEPERDHADRDEEQVRVRADPEEAGLAQGHRALALGDVVEPAALELVAHQITVPPLGDRTWPAK
jgi:hypothetical protein